MGWISMADKVKCLVCGKIITSEDALKHWQETGHNNWELILNGWQCVQRNNSKVH